MKSLISILFAFVFFVHSTANLWILGSFYANRDYIATHLCVNRFDKIPICRGSCYLNKELEKQKKQESSFPELQSLVIVALPVPFIQCDIYPQYFIFQKNYIVIRSVHLDDEKHLHALFKPPLTI